MEVSLKSAGYSGLKERIKAQVVEAKKALAKMEFKKDSSSDEKKKK